jgi:hypothetical protein
MAPMAEGIAMKRVGGAADSEALITFRPNDASCITGQVIFVAGWLLMS